MPDGGMQSETSLKYLNLRVKRKPTVLWMHSSKKCGAILLSFPYWYMYLQCTEYFFFKITRQYCLAHPVDYRARTGSQMSNLERYKRTRTSKIIRLFYWNIKNNVEYIL